MARQIHDDGFIYLVTRAWANPRNPSYWVEGMYTSKRGVQRAVKKLTPPFLSWENPIIFKVELLTMIVTDVTGEFIDVVKSP